MNKTLIVITFFGLVFLYVLFHEEIKSFLQTIGDFFGKLN